MQDVGGTILTAVISVGISLLFTFLFNQLVAIPKNRRAREEAERVAAQQQAEKERLFEERLKKVEGEVAQFPTYRQQSIKIQQELILGQQQVKAELKAEQSEIVQLCKSMNNTIESLASKVECHQQKSDEREKNDLRQKLIKEYRLFTDPHKNPAHAWSEMEYKAFMLQVKDYEALGGNDYIHKTVLPAMDGLEVVLMSDSERLEEIMSTRQL